MKATTKHGKGAKEHQRNKNTTAGDDKVDYLHHFGIALTLTEKNNIWQSNMEEARKGERKGLPKQEVPRRGRNMKAKKNRGIPARQQGKQRQAQDHRAHGQN